MQIPFAQVRAWLFEQALPFWEQHGLDHAHGGFHEDLTLAGAPGPTDFKRTRVVCRQIYVFSHAALLGWTRGDALAARGCDYLMARAYLGPGRGWARRLSRAGEVIDPSLDLYDLAFVLFAFAWRYRAAAAPEARTGMHEVMDVIEAAMALPEGYASHAPSQARYLQNPHMHLLEASLAAVEASGDARFLAIARRLADLFRRRLFDGATLGESFDAAWTRLPGDEGRALEPGHHFEWTWILGKFQSLTGEDMAGPARALTDFAEAHGVDPATGHVYNKVRDDGAILDPTSRIWTATERLKAHLALFEHYGCDARAAIAHSANALLNRYLVCEPRGAWIDHLDRDGRVIATTVPASIFYHLFLAFAELLRLEPRLRGDA